MKLRIADDLSLPLDAVTQTIAILAKRRAGKSYTMRRLIEQLFKAGQQVVIVDPKGDQWGIRSAADGKGPGLSIVILGGERGDVPLEPSGGEVVAKLVVEERVSVLLDISLFRKHECATFMTAFLENLYRLKAREIYRTPMMLVIDEADAIAPQKPQKGEERMLGAAEDIVRRGGQRGIGCVLVTQRSAVLNKNVLTQAQMLVALRTIAPQDLDAMQAWIDVHGTPEQRKTLMESLPSLPIGDAWFWSPGWPTAEGIFKRVHVLPIETFDSGATPAPGEKRVEPKHAADVDLDALQRQMAATIEKAKADDPKELRKQIADLKRQLAQRPKEQVTETKIEYIDVPVLKNGQLDKALLLGDRLRAIVAPLVEAIGKVTNAKMSAVVVPPIKPYIQVHRPQPVRHEAKQVPCINENGELTINKAQQRILDAVAWYESLGNDTPTVTQIGAVALIDPSGGHFSNLTGPLSSNGLISRSNGTIRLTDAGRAVASPIQDAGSLAEYHDVLRARLRKMKSAGGKTIDILDVIVAAGGESLRIEEIGEAIRLDHTGGYFSNCIGPLSTVGLIERRAGMVTPTDVLFPKGLQ